MLLSSTGEWFHQGFRQEMKEQNLKKVSVRRDRRLCLAPVTWRNTEISPGLPEDSCSTEWGEQINSMGRDITAERCRGSLPAGKLSVWEKAQPIFLSGKPKKRNNTKARGSKSGVVRKIKQGREKQSQLKFVITVLHYYMIMNEDLIVLHSVQTQFRIKWFLPEPISISSEAWNSRHCSRITCSVKTGSNCSRCSEYTAYFHGSINYMLSQWLFGCNFFAWVFMESEQVKKWVTAWDLQKRQNFLWESDICLPQAALEIPDTGFWGKNRCIQTCF